MYIIVCWYCILSITVMVGCQKVKDCKNQYGSFEATEPTNIRHLEQKRSCEFWCTAD